MAREEKPVSLTVPELAPHQIPQSQRILVHDADIAQERDRDAGAGKTIPQLDVLCGHQCRIEPSESAQHLDACQKAHAVQSAHALRPNVLTDSPAIDLGLIARPQRARGSRFEIELETRDRTILRIHRAF